MAVAPTTSALRFTVTVSQQAATSMGSSTPVIPCAFWLADTVLGFQWTVAININGEWQIISRPSSTPGIVAGKMYDDGEVSALVTEINRMGIIAWILKEAGEWFDALLKAFFGPKIKGATPVTGPVPVGAFQNAVNDSLATSLTARDVDNDGVPELVAL